MRYLILLLLVSCGGESVTTISYSKVCIEGHVYYKKDSLWSYRAFLANKLDDNGKPVKCQ